MLEDEQVKLNDNLQQYASSNYKLFVDSFHFFKYYKKEVIVFWHNETLTLFLNYLVCLFLKVDLIEDKLYDFINKLPSFGEKLSIFSEEAKIISKR